MNRPFEVQLPLEVSYDRRVLFAIELLDAVTLSRVSQPMNISEVKGRRSDAGFTAPRVNQGVRVVAEGLQGTPIVNASGYFVWLQEDIAHLRRVSIDPGVLPYESVELAASQVQLPLTTIELPPRVDYAFAPGITGLRGTLIEQRVFPPQRPVPVRNAEVQLRWLDENGIWHDAPTVSHTDMKGGDFVSILRLAPSEVPDLDASGAVTVRLRARRDGVNERSSADLKLLQGRVTDPSTLNPLTFAWDELQP